MKVEFRISAGIGLTDSQILEFDDGITDEELNDEWNSWSMNYIDGGWDKLEEGL